MVARCPSLMHQSCTLLLRLVASSRRPPLITRRPLACHGCRTISRGASSRCLCSWRWSRFGRWVRRIGLAGIPRCAFVPARQIIQRVVLNVQVANTRQHVLCLTRLLWPHSRCLAGIQRLRAGRGSRSHPGEDGAGGHCCPGFGVLGSVPCRAVQLGSSPCRRIHSLHVSHWS